jgi:hypothetical protein
MTGGRGYSLKILAFKQMQSRSVAGRNPFKQDSAAAALHGTRNKHVKKT